jgi:hypothetical protein
MGVESHELIDDANKANMHKKNNKNNVHLSPLDHNPSHRNSSVPPNDKGHPVNYAPSPNVRGGPNIRLESIDHAQHKNKLKQV